MNVGILGGGLTGLSVASSLKHESEVLERESECGGLCRTIVDRDFTFDSGGGHIIFSKDAQVLDYMLSLLGKNVLQQHRNTKIYYKGRYVKYPFENGLSDLSKEENFECLYEFIKVLTGRKKRPKNFRDWMLSTFGAGIANKYLIPYNEKIWNYPPEKMSCDWVEGRVPRPPVEDIIKSSLGIETEGYTHQLNFYYPEHGGIQSFIRLIERNANVTRKFNVTSVRRKGRKWVVSNGKEEKVYDKLVSTIPVQDLVAAMEGVPKKVKDAVKRLRYNSVAITLLGYDVDNLSDKHWVYFPDPKLLFHRIIYLKNYSERTCPPGKSSILAEVTYNEGDKFSKMSDAQVQDYIASRLNEAGIADKKKLSYARTVRSKYAYVVYDLNYNRNIKTVLSYLQKQGIVSCGRFAEFKYYNMDACIRRAWEVAGQLNKTT